ncbi:MAG: leucine-rich repeat domain-containing protein [Acidobacteria bacterium]|nr:leucine-rich repeat domain-containing protein [Acidobacteriota bacterium]
MKRAALIPVLFMFGILGMSQDYYLINHIAEEGWSTTITVYNDGLSDRNIILHYRSHPGEPETTFGDLTIPANESVAFDNTLFGYDGVAKVETEPDAPVRVKLSYRYGDSHSLAEFILPKTTPTGTSPRQWVIPNPGLSHMDWLGFAIANFNTDNARVTLEAYKNGDLVGTSGIDLIPDSKYVDISSGFFPGLNYPDMDMVIIKSDIVIPPPVAIIGNTAQDRHLFFLGSAYAAGIFVFPQTYTIPHVAESKWHTIVTAINTGDTEETMTLNSWESNGITDRAGVTFAVPARGSLTLAAGTDFGHEGTASVTVNSSVRVKLSYQYQDSESISDFMLTADTGKEWILPNSTHAWFQWLGIAVANPNEFETAIAIDAYNNGILLGTFAKKLAPHTKFVDLSGNIWPGVDYTGIDMVLVRSDQPVTAPISITGNTAQDRHVFFRGSKLNRETESGVSDPAFDAYLLANFDTNNDGVISVAERDLVTEIDTSVNNPWHGKIKDITGITNFKNLDTLICQNENLSWLPNMPGMSHLRVLKAPNNRIVRIDSFDPLEGMFHLYLDNNQLETIPDVSAMTALQTLWIKYNHLSEIPGISTLTGLKFLMIDGNRFTTLPDLTASAASITNLRFSSNQIDSIYNLSTLPHLQALDCSYNNLSSLPGLSSLSDLNFFVCSFNQITSLNALSSMTHLTWIGCSGNPLMSLPDLSGNTQLAYLWCENMNISSIPGLPAFSHMKWLYCDNTDISDLSGISGFTELENLDARNTLITSLPDMSALTQLKYLYVHDCLLTDIPDITHSTQLVEFKCSGNYFGNDDCSRIHAISAMGIPAFIYNPQHDGSTLTCP